MGPAGWEGSGGQRWLSRDPGTRVATGGGGPSHRRGAAGSGRPGESRRAGVAAPVPVAVITQEQQLYRAPGGSGSRRSYSWTVAAGGAAARVSRVPGELRAAPRWDDLLIAAMHP